MKIIYILVFLVGFPINSRPDPQLQTHLQIMTEFDSNLENYRFGTCQPPSAPPPPAPTASTHTHHTSLHHPPTSNSPLVSIPLSDHLTYKRPSTSSQSALNSDSPLFDQDLFIPLNHSPYSTSNSVLPHPPSLTGSTRSDREVN